MATRAMTFRVSDQRRSCPLHRAAAGTRSDNIAAVLDRFEKAAPGFLSSKAATALVEWPDSAIDGLATLAASLEAPQVPAKPAAPAKPEPKAVPGKTAPPAPPQAAARRAQPPAPPCMDAKIRTHREHAKESVAQRFERVKAAMLAAVPRVR